MLGIDISALSMAELKQLLEVARVREQHALVEQLTAELRARPSRAAEFGVGQPWSMTAALAEPQRCAHGAPAWGRRIRLDFAACRNPSLMTM